MKFTLRHSMKWSIFISIITFILACVFSVTSTIILEGVGWGIGMITVLILILIGIFFDIMGIASTSADEKPFHAMAAKKISGSRHGIIIIRNADRFSNFCNDVVGDICGIVSGAASAIVVMKLLSGTETGLIYTVVSVVFSGVVSALTVGGKALGKTFAIHYANRFVLLGGKVFYILEHHIGIRIFNGNKKKSSSGKRGKQRAT